MNIEQIKQDMDNGIMVSRATYEKLVEAALMMEIYIGEVAHHETQGGEAGFILEKVEAM